jgi:hypothetical protein
MADKEQRVFTKNFRHDAGGSSSYLRRGMSTEGLDPVMLAAAEKAGALGNEGDEAAEVGSPIENPNYADPEMADRARNAGIISGVSPKSPEGKAMKGPETYAPSIVGMVRTPSPPTDVPIGMGADNRKGVEEYGSSAEAAPAGSRASVEAGRKAAGEGEDAGAKQTNERQQQRRSGRK